MQNDFNKIKKYVRRLRKSSRKVAWRYSKGYRACEIPRHVSRLTWKWKVSHVAMNRGSFHDGLFADSVIRMWINTKVDWISLHIASFGASQPGCTYTSPILRILNSEKLRSVRARPYFSFLKYYVLRIRDPRLSWKSMISESPELPRKTAATVRRIVGAHTTVDFAKILGSADSFPSKSRAPRDLRKLSSRPCYPISRYIRFRESVALARNVRNYYLPLTAVSVNRKFRKSEILHSKTLSTTASSFL